MPLVQQKSESVPLIKMIRHGQVTLPARIREVLQLAEGDYLEAVVQSGGGFLKPTGVMDRRYATKELYKLMDAVQSRNGAYSTAEVTRDVQSAIRAVRKSGVD